MKLPRRSALASRRRLRSRLEVAVDHRADVDQLGRAAEVRARPPPHRTREAGDDVRYGISTHSSGSAPIASATRYATSAESMPPDSPSTARSKPAWRSWPRMNSAMTRRATSVSIASSAGSSKAGRRARSIGHGSAAWIRRRVRRPRSRPARSARSAASSRSWSSGRSSRSSGSAIRSRRMSAGAMSTQNRPSS